MDGELKETQAAREEHGSRFQNDLTQGGVTRQLLRFSMPFFFSTLIQQMYSMSDLLIVSHFAEESSVVGVSNGMQLTFLATAIAIGLSVGGTILVGQYYGAKRMEDVKKTVSTMMTMLVIVSVVMTVLFLVFGGALLHILRVPEQSIGEARAYLNICVSGLLFIFMYNAISGVLRGMGDSKRPLYFIAVTCVANIVLDLVLIAGFGMGAAGAAIATIICQAGSVAFSAIYLARKGFLFDFRPKSFVIDRAKLKLIFKLGIPACLQQVVVNFSFLLMTALVNDYGTSVSAAAGLAGRFNGFAIMPSLAFGNSVAMMCAQNLGAGNPGRALRTMRVGMGLSMAVTVFVFATAQFFPAQIMGFLSPEAAVVKAGVIYMRAFSWDYLVVPFVFCLFGLINGAGHSTFTMLTTFITSIGLRVPLAILLSRPYGLNLGLSGVGLAAPLASVGALVCYTIYLIGGKWRNVVIHRPETQSDLTG
ncbi:MAG: MATE family efflux transporter [Oscillospiraceae bacterium]|nr:MATE family efflux transporter [Oscillospiraceae bacterium]